MCPAQMLAIVTSAGPSHLPHWPAPAPDWTQIHTLFIASPASIGGNAPQHHTGTQCIERVFTSLHALMVVDTRLAPELMLACTTVDSTAD